MIFLVVTVTKSRPEEQERVLRSRGFIARKMIRRIRSKVGADYSA